MNGATIPKDRTAIPQDVAELLREADNLVSSLDNTRLQDLLRDEVAAALRATGLRVGCDLPDAERVTLGSARLPGSDGE